MSFTTDRERQEDALEQRVERAKRVMRDLQQVLNAYGGEESVSALARRLSTSRPRIHWLQRVLGLRDGRTKSGRLTTRFGAHESRAMEAAP